MNNTNNTIIVGLDIGTTKIVAIAGRKNEYGKLEILGFGQAKSAGVKHGIVLNLDHCTKAIEKALKNCKENYPNLSFKDVYVGIAGHHIKSRQTNGIVVREDKESTITKIDVDKLLSTQRKTLIPEGEEIIDIIPQEYIVDNQHSTLEPIGMLGSKLAANFHTVTGSKYDIKNIKRCVDNNGLRTVDLVLQPLASAASVMTPQDIEAGVAIIDIGGGTTDMAVFYEGVLQHTAVIPFAGSNITDDIKKGLKVLEEQAEVLKKDHGNALPEETESNKHVSIPAGTLEPKIISLKNLSHIIHARIEEIFKYVIYELKKLHLDGKLNRGIILTGGGSQLKNIIQLCQFTTGIETRMGYPNEHLTGEHSKTFSNPMYSTCIGLILRGFSDLESGKFDEAGANQLNVSEDPSNTSESTKEAKTILQEQQEPQDLFTQTEDSTGGKSNIWKGAKLPKINKGGEKLKKIFDNLKDKFMYLFDDEIDNEELK